MPRNRTADNSNPVALPGLFFLFLRIGATAFGGFMSLVSIVQTELVDKRKCIAQSDMLNGISLASILPGPVAVNVVAYAGFVIRGVPGALVCMVAVILPSFLLMVLAAVAFSEWGKLPLTTAILETFMPAVVAVIIHAGANIGRKVIADAWALIPVAAAFMALVFAKGFYITLIVIALGGVWGFFTCASKKEPVFEECRRYSVIGQCVLAVFFAILLLIFIGLPNALQAYPVAHLFSIFSGMSLTLFGGGYVFIPMIQKIVVEAYQWINMREFEFAIAVGQLTPGPILISATYIGYSFAGIIGAVVATFGMFLPPALLITVAADWLKRISTMSVVERILQGIRLVVVGMILAAAAIIALRVNHDWKSALIFVLSIVALFGFNTGPTIVIPAAGALGLAAYFFGL